MMSKRPTQRPSKPLSTDEATALQSRPVRHRDPNQPHLPFDPMPGRIEPCLAELRKTPPTGSEWSWDIKWDGYRLAVHVEPTGVRLLTRGGYDWTHRFPAIAESAQSLQPTTMILDGEAVVLDKQGRSDFNLLQRSLGANGKNGGKLPSRNSVLYAFDLLYLDGHDLRRMDYETRRHLLEDTVDGLPSIRLSEEFDGDPQAFFTQACHFGLEGIIGKRRDRPYRSGRTGDWIKVKCIQSDSFAVIGYEPSSSIVGGVGSLLLAGRRNGKLKYVGSVGTGFSHSEARRLLSLLEQVRSDTPPVRVNKKKAVLVEPAYIAETEYRAWTNDGKLRHPSYKGLREAEDSADISELE